MNRQFDDRFDELFHEKFSDFKVNPPEHILSEIKASVNKGTQGNNISSFIKRNIALFLSIIFVPVAIMSYFAFTAEKGSSNLTKEKTEVKQSINTNTELTNNNNGTPVTENNQTVENNSRPAPIIITNETCGLSCELKASGNKGKWQCSGLAAIKEPLASVTEVTVQKEGLYSFSWIPDNSEQAIEQINIRFLKTKSDNKAKDLSVCGKEVELKANSANGTGNWIPVKGVTFADITNPASKAICSNYGLNSFIWSDKGNCATNDTFNVLFNDIPDARFTIADQKCINTPVLFSALNKSLARYEWHIEGSQNNSTNTPEAKVLWNNPGNYNVKLRVWNNNNCMSEETGYIKLNQSPDVKFETTLVSCNKGGTITAQPTDKVAFYKYYWMNEPTPGGNIRDNLQTGEYQVLVKDKNNCESTYNVKLTGSKQLKADFYHSGYEPTPPSTVQFINTTSLDKEIYKTHDGLKFVWDFGDGQKSDEEAPKHIYEKAGTYTVKLIAYDKSGCSDTYSQNDISIGTAVSGTSNVFTPNGDGQNDVFFIKGTSLTNFHAVITNARGEKVFEWTNPELGWDGTINSSGTQASSGIYYYTVTAKTQDGNAYTDKGMVHLRRN